MRVGWCARLLGVPVRRSCGKIIVFRSGCRILLAALLAAAALPAFCQQYVHREITLCVGRHTSITIPPPQAFITFDHSGEGAATAGEGGTNDVQISGNHEGTSTIAFNYDYNNGSPEVIVVVVVTVTKSSPPCPETPKQAPARPVKPVKPPVNPATPQAAAGPCPTQADCDKLRAEYEAAKASGDAGKTWEAYDAWWKCDRALKACPPSAAQGTIKDGSTGSNNTGKNDNTGKNTTNNVVTGNSSSTDNSTVVTTNVVTVTSTTADTSNTTTNLSAPTAMTITPIPTGNNVVDTTNANNANTTNAVKTSTTGTGGSDVTSVVAGNIANTLTIPAGGGHSATVLPPGTILVIGGFSSNVALAGGSSGGAGPFDNQGEMAHKQSQVSGGSGQAAELLGPDDLVLHVDAQGRVVLSRGPWELATLNATPPFGLQSDMASWMAAPLPDLPPPQIIYSLVANGNSSGEAFELQVMDPSGQFKKVALPDGIVLEPAAKKAPPLKPAGQTGKMLTQRITAFCLQFAKLPPAAGMLYKFADPAAQRQYKPAAYVLEAGYKLGAAGQLNPDSDPKAYIDFIRQYAVWAQQEGWNEQQFTEHWIERTKKIAQAMNRAGRNRWKTRCARPRPTAGATS